MPILSSRHASIQEERITCVNFTSIPHKYCTIFMWDGNCVNRPLLSSKLISDGHTSNILHSLILFPDLHPAFVGSSVIVLWFSMYRSVPQIRPPFCNLSLSTKHRGGLYAECDDFSRDYALLPVPVKHDLIVSGGWGPNARWRDAPDASGRLASFSVEG